MSGSTNYSLYCCQTCGNPSLGLIGRFFEWIGWKRHKCDPFWWKSMSSARRMGHK